MRGDLVEIIDDGVFVRLNALSAHQAQRQDDCCADEDDAKKYQKQLLLTHAKCPPVLGFYGFELSNIIRMAMSKLLPFLDFSNIKALYIYMQHPAIAGNNDEIEDCLLLFERSVFVPSGFLESVWRMRTVSVHWNRKETRKI